MKTKVINQAGFTLVEVMIVTAIIGLLASIAIPNFVRARTTSQMNACINNLRQIEYAKQLWALENKKVGADEPTWTEIRDYVNQMIACPGTGVEVLGSGYNVGNVNTLPTCAKAAEGHVLSTPVASASVTVP
ncbi:MAG TPA: prepilin-type N-terminal cleavage/methylation domain-containing protein [Clostridia bacterium]|nr:prepilin-type N-terminal cleavage/methylation domain-containing protein [Clostridia bacterium]